MIQMQSTLFVADNSGAKKVQCIKAAMFAELPPKGKLNPHRDPFAGSPRYHPTLNAPISDKVTSMLMDSVTGGKMVNQ